MRQGSCPVAGSDGLQTLEETFSVKGPWGSSSWGSSWDPKNIEKFCPSAPILGVNEGIWKSTGKILGL
jgi:hypothetical protein